MLFTKATVAAFVALCALVNAAPIQFLSGNDNDGIVVGSGNGGKGGNNAGEVVVISGAKSKGSKWGSSTSSTAAGGLKQNANGGDGSAVGSFGSGNTFSSRNNVNVDPSVSVLSNNDNDGLVIGSGNGGMGGTNLGGVFVGSGAKSSGSKGSTSSFGIGGLKQNANGGSGSAVGTYGSHNHFERGGEGWQPISILSGNDNDGIVVGSGNGGNGGTNLGGVFVGSGAKSSKSKGGKTSSTAAGGLKQHANGGDGSAVGTYGSGNTFSERGKSSQYGSNNDNDGFVFGSGNGGKGGSNKGIVGVFSGASSSGWSSGDTSSEAIGLESQKANGGDGSAVGTYGSHNHARGGEGWEPSSILSNNDNDGFVFGSGNGGKGGSNKGAVIVVSGSKSHGSSGDTSSAAGGALGQNANGGSGSAVGSYGSHNHF